MTTEYSYTKSGACPSCLRREIEMSSSIDTEFERILYNEPSDLKLYFVNALSSEEETALDSIVSAHDGSQSQFWYIWCNNCGEAFEYWGSSFPTVCLVSGQACTDLVDITDEYPAVHGYSVSEVEPGGYYEWWISGSQRRYAKHRAFIPYDTRLTFYPTIQFGTVVYDGVSDLRVLFAGKEGFVVEITVTQTKKKYGGQNVKFTWTGVKPS